MIELAVSRVCGVFTNFWIRRRAIPSASGKIALALSVAGGVVVSGQGAGRNSTLLQKNLLPPELRSAVDALGTRVVRPGNERVVSTGILRKGTSVANIRVMHEMPNKIRLELGGNRSVGFDGNSAWASDRLTDNDLEMAESLGEDSAEAILYGVQNGLPVRPLGERFRTDHGAAPDYQGPWLDIFEVFTVTKDRGAAETRQKHVVFDNGSRELRYVRYRIIRQSRSITVQTEWSGWTRVNGQAVATRVARREDGAEVWSFSRSQISIGPAVPDGAFGRN